MNCIWYTNSLKYNRKLLIFLFWQQYFFSFWLLSMKNKKIFLTLIHLLFYFARNLSNKNKRALLKRRRTNKEKVRKSKNLSSIAEIKILCTTAKLKTNLKCIFLRFFFFWNLLLSCYLLKMRYIVICFSVKKKILCVCGICVCINFSSSPSYFYSFWNCANVKRLWCAKMQTLPKNQKKNIFSSV